MHISSKIQSHNVVGLKAWVIACSLSLIQGQHAIGPELVSEQTDTAQEEPETRSRSGPSRMQAEHLNHRAAGTGTFQCQRQFILLVQNWLSATVHIVTLYWL